MVTYRGFWYLQTFCNTSNLEIFGWILKKYI